MICSLRRFRPYLPLLAVLAVAAWFAFSNAFIQDDAYISFNYAKWFSRGAGLVWYPRAAEFGYTNFLYTLLIGAAMALRIPPEIASDAINAACFFGALVLTYAMGVRLLGSRMAALMPVLILATHHTFTAYATGGLETMWVTFWLMLFYWHIQTADDRTGRAQAQRLGAMAALLMLSRLDMVVLLLPGYVFMAAEKLWPIRAQLRNGIGRFAWTGWYSLRPLLPAALIPTLVTLGFLLVCVLSYGQALPNSFYMKMPGGGMVDNGLRYLWLYVMLQLYMPLLVPLAVGYFFLRRGSLHALGGFALLLAAVVGVWLCYVVYVGGDFMEYRFLVPVMAFYYLFIFRMVLVFLTRRHMAACVGITALFLLANADHAALFTTQKNVWDFPEAPKPFTYAFVESTDTLDDWVSYTNQSWRDVGKALGALFAPSDVKVAATAAGAIGYYSDLRIIDLLGLNTRDVRDNNVPFLNRPGHQHRASQELVDALGVNLNISHPQTVCLESGRYVWTPSPVGQFLYLLHETLFVPLGNGCFVVADYMKKHPKIDGLIKKQVIVRYKDVAARSDCPGWLCQR